VATTGGTGTGATVSVLMSTGVTISPPNADGCSYYDILKTNVTTLLHAVFPNAAYVDYGQGTGGYGAIARNTTADEVLAGEISVGTVPIYANNAAALAGGLVAGNLYRSGADPDPVYIVH
jgi:hypothetical protein